MRAAAATDLVKKGRPARAAVAKARDRAKDKAVYEEVMLRIDCGTDEQSLTIGKKVDVNIDSSDFDLITHKDGKKYARLKIIVNAANNTDGELKLVIRKATFVLLDKKHDMPVQGPDKKFFERTLAARMPKQFEYGDFLPPTYRKGTRCIVVFEFAVGEEKGLIRTAVLELK